MSREKHKFIFMKKIIICLFALSFFLGAHAQEVKNVVKVNPLGLIIGSASLSYERLLNEKSSVQLNANYGSWNILGNKISSIGAGLDYRMYISKTKVAPNGWYLSPGASFSSVSYTSTDIFSNTITGSISSIGLKADMGYQWVWDSGFALELFFGAGYGIASGDSDGISLGGATGIAPRLGIALGWGF